ncbi:MAG: hypothetical protein AAF747_07750 [Planctomycetota bacterium]
MTLKTFRGKSMVEALAEVKRDFGPSAVILHTRTIRTGGVLGVGRRSIIEITASDELPPRQPTQPKPNRVPATKLPPSIPEPVPAPVVAQVQGARELLRGPANGTATQSADASDATNGNGNGVAEPRPDAIRDRARETLAKLNSVATANAERAAEEAQPEPEADNGFVADPAWPSRMPAEHEPAGEPEPAAELDSRVKVTGHSNGTGNGANNGTGNGANNGTGNGAGNGSMHTEEAQAEIGVRHEAETPVPKPVLKPEAGQPQQATVAAAQSADAVAVELASLKRMMSRVLQSNAAGSTDATPRSQLAAGTLPDVVMDHYLKLIDQDLSAESADRVIGAVRNELSSSASSNTQVVRAAVLRHLAGLIHAAPPQPVQPGERRVIALLGPTGVGKTTTVAKLAATYKLRQQRSVGLITSDTYRISAVEQLRTYAEIIGLELRVATTPDDMIAARRALASCEVVLIDTTGRSPNDAARLDELSALVRAAEPDERHLVLTAVASESSMQRIASRFSAVAPDRVILTKLDEAVCPGGALNALTKIGLPLSYLATGQEVPEHLEPARAERIAQMVLDGELQPAAADAAANGRAG